MRYADNHCTYTETYNPQEYHFKGPCISCKAQVVVSVPSQELYQYRRGALIQDAMPSVKDREFLISGVCSDCFDKMWEEE